MPGMDVVQPSISLQDGKKVIRIVLARRVEVCEGEGELIPAVASSSHGIPH